jgi:hypothetical protein
MTHPSVRATRGAALAVAAARLGACQSDTGGPTAKPIGVLQVTADGDVSATTTRPTVTFIRALGLNVGNTRNPGDTCEVLSFNETTGTPEPVPGVAAGEAISLDLSGTTTQLVPTDQTIGRVYAPAAAASVTFQPGDSAKITVPGSAGGFPATTFAIKTAEPIIWVDPIAVPTAGSTANIVVKWNAGDVNSAMLLSLRYEIPSSTNVQQVLCLMQDDGEFAIPNNKLSAWEATTTTERRAVATRVRNSGVALEGAVMYGSTSFRKTIPVATP